MFKKFSLFKIFLKHLILPYFFFYKLNFISWICGWLLHFKSTFHVADSVGLLDIISHITNHSATGSMSSPLMPLWDVALMWRITCLCLWIDSPKAEKEGLQAQHIAFKLSSSPDILTKDLVKEKKIEVLEIM
jgi:hypothetical protein